MSEMLNFPLPLGLLMSSKVHFVNDLTDCSLAIDVCRSVPTFGGVLYVMLCEHDY